MENKFTFGRESQLGAKRRLDYIIQRKSKTSMSPIPVFVLEAKKIDKSKLLRDHLPQLFDYLRSLCIEHSYTHLDGVLTNYETWIFVRYDLTDEVKNVQQA